MRPDSRLNCCFFLKDTTTPRISDGYITDEEDTENAENYEDNHSISDQINNDDFDTTDTPETGTHISQSTQLMQI